MDISQEKYIQHDWRNNKIQYTQVRKRGLRPLVNICIAYCHMSRKEAGKIDLAAATAVPNELQDVAVVERLVGKKVEHDRDLVRVGVHGVFCSRVGPSTVNVAKKH